MLSAPAPTSPSATMPTVTVFVKPTPASASSSSCVFSSSSSSSSSFSSLSTSISPSSKRTRENTPSSPPLSPLPPPAACHRKRPRIDTARARHSCHYHDPGLPSCRVSPTLDYPASASSSVSNFSIPLPSATLGLPDEVLVSIFRFVDHASRLASLRTVCKQWCKVIDETPDVWRAVSFKNASFLRPVINSSHVPHLQLGRRRGEAAVSLAARSGNEWACFLKRTIFERQTLHGITISQPVASMLVSGERTLDARPFPPWQGDQPPDLADGAWVAVHAARRISDQALNMGNFGEQLGTAGAVALQNPTVGGETRRARHNVDSMPRGAIVGMIHVRDACRASGREGADSGPSGWIWRIDRAVSLKKPIRCAGYVGLWAMSGCLTDLLVNAMHSQ